MLIRTRLMLGVGALLTGTVAILVFVILDGISSTIDRAEERELRGYFEALAATTQLRTNTALALAQLVATLPEVKHDLAAGNRAGLLTRFTEPFAALKQEAGIEQFQFHRPPATSFLRLQTSPTSSTSRWRRSSITARAWSACWRLRSRIAPF